MRRAFQDNLVLALCSLATAIVLLLLGTLLWQVVVFGAPGVSFAFLTEAPSVDLVSGGIWPAICGTALVTLLMTVAVIPVGVATAIWLSEYARIDSRWASLIRIAVQNLAAVPSIVFGLFGLGFFVLFVGQHIDQAFYEDAAGPVWGRPGVLWSSLTLALLTLPVVIVTAEEALRSVPQGLRAASLALGASRFETVLHVVLPEARAGIFTGAILSVSRGAGEVAPILFTGAAVYTSSAPTDARDSFMHLGYHVYSLATQSPNIEAARPMLFSTVLVLLTLTFTLNIVAITARATIRARRKEATA